MSNAKSNQYPPGFIGRIKWSVEGCDRNGLPRIIEEGSVVEVVSRYSIYNAGDSLLPGDDGDRYAVRLLQRSGQYNKKDVSYDGMWNDGLDPEPGVIDWCLEDSQAAMRQGWEIFSTDACDHPPFELQRLDGSEVSSYRPGDHIIHDRFKHDEDAWMFVWTGAVKHQEGLAKRALQFLYYRSPEEYEKIRKCCLNKLVTED